jgi:hypothetical protein
MVQLFFQKAGVEIWQLFGFLNWRTTGTHGACEENSKSRVFKPECKARSFIHMAQSKIFIVHQNKKQSSQATAAESHILRHVWP